MFQYGQASAPAAKRYVGQKMSYYKKTIEVHSLEQFRLLTASDQTCRRYLFRGEDSLYEYRQPAIWRLGSEIHRQAQHVRTSGISRLFLEQEITPRISESRGIPLHNGQWLGDFDLCYWHDGIPSYRQIYWQVVALLQHYGYRTAYLDITFDPQVALFFSSYSASLKRVHTDGQGYVYQWSIAEVCQELYSKVLLTSLTKLSEFLRQESASQTSRPGMQVAGSLRVGIGAEDPDYVADVLSALNELATVYVIDRSVIPPDHFSPSTFFPSDPLPTRISMAATSWYEEASLALTQARSSGDDRVATVLEHALRDIHENCPTRRCS
jgi:hypothetical protein